MNSNTQFTQDQTIESKNELIYGEYENCIFNSCNFENQDLSGIKFQDCTFNGCNLSNANISGAAFQNVRFNDCKMLGLHFEVVNPFGLAVSFLNCRLNHSSFYKLKLKNTAFKNCQLLEIDFAETDLTSCKFDDCDLSHTIFDRTILEKADFRTAFNFSINPETNRIKKAKFSLVGLPGLLQKYQLDIDS